jgi:hypothetical protein
VPPDTLTLTAHCLLRLYVALSMEAACLDHGQASATAELNALTQRQLQARQWLELLEPHYLGRFSPSE